MNRREREQLMGEHGVRGPTPIEDRLAARLQQDLEGSPVHGRPIPRRLRNFRSDVARHALSVAGPPAHVRRLRQIEQEIDRHVQRLEAMWLDLARDHVGNPEGFARRWRAVARRWNFTAVNELIDRHNRYYPVEARLAMDPRTGDFVPVGGTDYRRRALGAGWVVRCLPAALPPGFASHSAP